MESFDHVIVGAGAAGSVLAERLSEDAGTSVCVLEAAGPDRHPYISIPAGFVKTFYGDRFLWGFESEPLAALGGRSLALPQGKVVGCFSSINGLVYNRGQVADFDSWAKMGNRGWGFEDLLPYFKRSERRIGPGDDGVRGREGSLPITDVDWINPLSEAFIEAAVAMGIPRNPDYNSGRQFGTGYFQRYIHQGKHVSAAKAFLHPALKRPGVRLVTRARVIGLELDGRQVTGVRYLDAGGGEHIAGARRDVISSAGAVNSPRLLLLSGHRRAVASRRHRRAGAPRARWRRGKPARPLFRAPVRAGPERPHDQRMPPLAAPGAGGRQMAGWQAEHAGALPDDRFRPRQVAPRRRRQRSSHPVHAGQLRGRQGLCAGGRAWHDLRRRPTLTRECGPRPHPQRRSGGRADRAAELSGRRDRSADHPRRSALRPRPFSQPAARPLLRS